MPEQWLLIDVGAGTMDVLCLTPGQRLHTKAVVASPVRSLACRIEETPGDLVVLGGEMGGGPVTQVLRQKASRGDKVVITASAAATLSHDLAKVRRWGLEVVDDERALSLAGRPEYACVSLTDIDPLRIRALVNALGIECSFDVVAVCAQDHGVAPAGVSHLDFRHRLFARLLEETPHAHALLFRAGSIPEEMNRLRTMAANCADLSAGEIFVMDSGMAAITGACLDVSVTGCRTFMVLDVATSHTVVAVIHDGQLAGFFEYHTRDMSAAVLDRLAPMLADGRLTHQQVLEQGGHGAWIDKAPGFDQVEKIIVTGPQRHLVAGSSLNLIWGAPAGDNMMTGTVGLAEAVRRAKNLPSLTWS